MTDPAAFWDREAINPTHHNWLADPQIRDYANRLIGGGEPLWPLDWFQRRYPRTFARGLSIGCGTGALERDVIRRGICERMDAFDASDGSLATARSLAQSEGAEDRIHYRKADFDRVTLPRRTYDVVFFHQSLHHVSRMERLLWQVISSMKPGAVLYLDEYVGPSRSYWNDRTVAWYRALYHLIPRGARYTDEMLLPVQWDDASEAQRSGEILSRLRIGFRIEAFRGYGGNLLAVMFPGMLLDRIDAPLVASLIESEKALLAGGVPHFYAVITAEPKRGLGMVIARLRYLIEPKFRRIRRELRLRLGSGRQYEAEENAFRP